MSSPAVAEFDNVSKNYTSGFFGRRQLQAVTSVGFSIGQGEVFGLVGPNRAGKTTLVKLLLSLCRPTSGCITRFGRPLNDRSTLARVGYVHENQAFPRYLTAASLLEYYGCLALLSEPEVRRRAPELLERVGLSDRSREPISGFSKGMVQRLALAQALLNDPDLLVLDEPAEGLDQDGRRLLHDAIADRRHRGRSVLFVSHVLADVEQLCDRLAVLVRGRLAYVGALAALTGADGARERRPLTQALDELYTRPPS